MLAGKEKIGRIIAAAVWVGVPGIRILGILSRKDFQLLHGFVTRPRNSTRFCSKVTARFLAASALRRQYSAY